MDPVTVIVTALTLGAAKGVGDTATTAVKDAYQGLRRMVGARFADSPSRELVLAEHDKKPDAWQAPLAEALTDTGLVADSSVVEAAQRLLGLLDEAGSRAGKYTIDMRRARGVQVGDHNTQTNTFTTAPPHR